MLIVALSLCLDELTHSIRSMPPSASSSTDEGMHHKYCMAINLLCSLLAITGEQIVNIVPDALLEELGDLRIGYAKLIYNYEKQLHHSPEAQEEFVKFLPRLFHKPVEDHSFQSHFNTLIEGKVSLFNIFYLKESALYSLKMSGKDSVLQQVTFTCLFSLMQCHH